MNITIVGAGGMGSRFAVMLKQAGNDVTLIDGWKDNVQAIRENGIQAQYNGAPLVVKLPIYELAEVDQIPATSELVILFVKSNQLDQTCNQIKKLLTPNTYILCLLNGLGHEEVLQKYIDTNRLLLGITMWTAGMQGPGHPILQGNGNIELQNFGDQGEDFAQKVVQVMDDAGLNAVYSQNVKYSIWRKACVNGTLNCLCSLLECNMKQLGQTKEAPEFLKTIIAEFAAVANHEGVDLDQKEVYQHIAETFDGDIAEHYPSMYQDLVQNHRLTEIDYINGAVWRKGQKYGVPTPYCQLITQLIHAKEQILCK